MGRQRERETEIETESERELGEAEDGYAKL